MTFIPLWVLEGLRCHHWDYFISLGWFLPAIVATALVTGDSKSYHKRLDNILDSRIEIGDFYAISCHFPLAVQEFYDIRGEKDKGLAGAIADMFQCLFDMILAKHDFQPLFTAYRDYACKVVAQWHI
ncbi:hypothetical protein E1B28_003289 [Marasmius oreades]|uniref:Uncharacterized protein n=1 Tax=Marasmius oreades TaxID=181124 RepID=A0A9P7RM57_9AGAR|nr:uncharacterized protein E1B28_003289 [Marasmius oreades]KAG7085746.1 hypothetical protein E1B28_003289 [Marasmius oreades]